MSILKDYINEEAPTIDLDPDNRPLLLIRSTLT